MTDDVRHSLDMSYKRRTIIKQHRQAWPRRLCFPPAQHIPHLEYISMCRSAVDLATTYLHGQGPLGMW